MISESTSESYRKALEKDSAEHREAFEQELEEIIDNAKRVATSVAVIGGGFALSYYIIKKLTSSKKKIKYKTGRSGKKKEVVIQKQPSVFSTVGSVILTEMAVFLLAMAKEKLAEYLENTNSEENGASKNA